MKAIKELNELKDEELVKRLSELRKELMKFRSQVASGTIPRNPGRIKVIKVRDDIGLTQDLVRREVELVIQRYKRAG